MGRSGKRYRREKKAKNGVRKQMCHDDGVRQDAMRPGEYCPGSSGSAWVGERGKVAMGSAERQMWITSQASHALESRTRSLLRRTRAIKGPDGRQA